MSDVVEAKGYCSRIRFDGDTVTIEFGGMHKSTLGMDSAVIPVESIVDVKMRKSTWMTNGVLCVQVMLPDGQVSDVIDNPALAMESPYCASIMRTRQGEFDALVAAVGAALPDAPVPAAENLFLRTKGARKQAGSAAGTVSGAWHGLRAGGCRLLDRAGAQHRARYSRFRHAWAENRQIQGR